jgi:hypothetical protein
MATSYSGTLTIALNSGGRTKSDDIVKTGSSRISIEEDVATGETDFEIQCKGVDISACTFIYIKSTQDVTLETNANDATGGNTLTLVADEPYVWWTAAPFVNVLTEDITTDVFVTNASGATATVTMEFIQDATPA